MRDVELSIYEFVKFTPADVAPKGRRNDLCSVNLRRLLKRDDGARKGSPLRFRNGAQQRSFWEWAACWDDEFQNAPPTTTVKNALKRPALFVARIDGRELTSVQ